MAGQSNSKENGKALSGFAALSPAERKAANSKGGKAAVAKGTLHRFTFNERSKGGKKGGKKVSRDFAHMEEIGRSGGKVRGRQISREAASRNREALRGAEGSFKKI